MRFLRLALLCLGGFAAGCAAAFWWSTAWPVTTYDLCPVAQGPFAPGHPGMAFLPRERAPQASDIEVRMELALEVLATLAAMALIVGIVWGRPQAKSLVTLDAWNMAGLEDTLGPDLGPLRSRLDALETPTAEDGAGAAAKPANRQPRSGPAN